MTNKLSTSQIMLIVSLACLPAITVTSLVFGLGILKNILISILFALFFESICLKLRKREIKHSIFDFSALLTAILFSLCLPPDFSNIKILIGIFFAIVVTKHIYGGLGHNIFNPAMVGYVVLLIAFPQEFTNWPTPNNIVNYVYNIFHLDLTNLGVYIQADDISQATPLDPIILTSSINKHLNFLYAFYLINCAWLVSGMYLVYKNIINIRLPLGFLSGLFLTSLMSYYLVGGLYNPIQHIFLGASMMGAFFIITDPVTASVTRHGQYVYSITAGMLCFLIREYGGYPDGVAFAVLFMNTWVPLINKLTAKYK